MLELKNVCKFYNDNSIVTVGLRNINLKLDKGEFVAITGDSGSGKSTLLNVISSIDSYDEGEILFYGNETFYFNQNDSDLFRKNNVSFIFQKYNIIDSYTVLQNVMLPLIIRGKSDDEAKIEALEIINRVGLADRISNKGSNLSGGEKQRCVIARALASDSLILACDEPTGNLDSKTSEEIINLIKEVSKDKLVLMVTHDYDQIKDICTRKIKLSDGEIVEDISFSDGIKEEDKPLDFKDDKPSRKVISKLAFSNVFSTPKKTILTAAVYTFVAFALLFLSLLMIDASYDANYSFNEEYGIVTDNRLIVYDKDNKSLDMDQLSSLINTEEYYINAFYEQINARIAIDNYIQGASFTFTDLDYDLIEGNEPSNSNEFVVVFPENSYYYGFQNCLGEEIYIYVSMDYDYQYSIGTLSGIAYAKDINNPYIVGSDETSNLTNIMINNEVKYKYKYDDNEYYYSMIYIKNLDKSYFAIPNNMKDSIENNFMIGQIYHVSYDLDVVYTDEVVNPTLFCGKDFISGDVNPTFDGVKELTIYSDNTSSLERRIEDLGYLVSTPSKIKKDSSIDLLILYVLMIVVIIALIIMFLISYIVLQKIYLTKTKDYSIFRTLGLVSNDIKKILYLENLLIMGISIIMGIIFVVIFNFILEVELLIHLNLLTILLFVMVMLLFSLLISIRLNNKIFKFSVFKSIKEGSE